MSEPSTQKRRVALVAVEHPEGVEELIRITIQLSEADSVEVVVLTVSLGAVKREEQRVSAIEAVVERLAEDEGLSVRSLVVQSSSVARGILDTARERQADLIVLGLAPRPTQRSGIGTVAENVAAATPCRVVIYRPGLDTDVQRIAIACDAADLSISALRIGTLLGERFQRPVELVTIGPERLGGAARRRLRARLRDLEIDPELPRTHLTAGDPIGAIFKHITDHTLLVTSFDRTASEDEHWFYTRGATALLDGADGPVALIIRDRKGAMRPASTPPLRRALRWLRPTLTPVEQRDMLSRAAQMSEPSLDYTVLVIIAAILASLGLLANSGAVIIGAMLVAPLMSPLVAFATAIAGGRPDLVGRATLALLEGFLLAFGVAVVAGLVSGSPLVTPEMQARGNPALIDMGVALAAGCIAAYANARKDIPAALAGVAIAAALMPPICTVGLGVALGNGPLWRGALLLFITNIAAIVLAAWATFFYLGLRPRSSGGGTRRTFISTALVGVFSVILGVVFTLSINPAAPARIERALLTSFPADELVGIEVRRSDPIQVIATVRRSFDRPITPVDVTRAANYLSDALGQPVRLEVVVQQAVIAEP